MAHVFISYAHSDRKIAQSIERGLRKANTDGWLDLKNIAGGEEWSPAIDNAVRKARALLLVLSPAASKSDWVTYEWIFALGAKKRVIPVLVKKTKMHPKLAALHYVDFTVSRETRWERLLAALRTKGDAKRPLAKTRKHGPAIYAQFDLEAGHPVLAEGGNSYVIWLGTRNVPRGTKRVTYEILDEDFETDENFTDNPWTVTLADDGGPTFGDWMNSWGDVLITAKGKGITVRWQSKATLSQALRRGHRHRSKLITDALTDIENH
jgi:hypothetical protein